MVLKIFFINFSKGYHIGWKRAEKIIDHVTILRALINLAYNLDDQVLIKNIMDGKILATAMMPTLPNKDYSRLLVPFPTIPSLIKTSKLGITWATLYLAHKITCFAQKCDDNGGKPLLKGLRKDGLTITCEKTEEPFSLTIDVKNKIACLKGDDCDSLPIINRDLFEKIKEYHNRIDRVTGATDVYEINGWKPNIPLWLGIESDENILGHVENLLVILGELGIGAYRSRGWGWFRLVRDIKIHKIDKEIIDKYIGWRTGYNTLLGSIPPDDKWMDLEKSYAKTRTITGIAGPVFEEYKLPLIHAMDIGGLIYVHAKPSSIPASTIPISTSISNYKALILFNPLVVNNLEQ